MKHVQALAVAVLVLTIAHAQDTVTFKSGKKLECQVLEYDNGTLRLKDSSGKTKTGSISAVKHIKFGELRQESKAGADKGRAKKPPPKRKPTEESAAGSGFFYKNVRFSSQFGMAQAIGEMANRSGRDYQLANFVLSAYDAEGNLLKTGYANISTFADGNTKSFEVVLMGIPVNQISKYKIQFENGL